MFAAVLIAGCSFSPPPPGPASGATPLAPVVGVHAPDAGPMHTLPLTALQLTPREQSRFFRAVGTRANDCLKRLGHQRVFDTAAGDAAEPILTGKLGVTDAEHAQQYGYGQSRAELAAQAGKLPGRLDSYRDADLSAEVLAAIEGGEGQPGCLVRAVDAVLATVPQSLPAHQVRAILADSTLPELIAAADAAAMQQDQVQQALVRWRGCMAAADYPAKHPTTVIGDVGIPTGSVQQGADVPTDTERQVAMTDVACKHQTGLLTVWNTAVYAEQSGLLAQYGEQLAGYEAVKRVYVNAADAVLGG